MDVYLYRFGFKVNLGLACIHGCRGTGETFATDGFMQIAFPCAADVKNAEHNFQTLPEILVTLSKRTFASSPSVAGMATQVDGFRTAKFAE